MLRLPAHAVQQLRSTYDGRRVCVTGGAGFIGGHLVDALLSLGAVITVLDDLSNADARHLAELIEMEPDRVRLVNGSILEPGALDEAIGGMGGCDRVFHLAAMVSVPHSIEDPERCFAINADGTLRVAQAAVRHGVKRLVYSASSSAYGESEALPKHECLCPEPISPYAISKLAGEHVMRAWSASYGLSSVCLRYFNIFGPRQRADSPYSGVIAVFARKLLAGEAPTIFGDGEQTRDFTYVCNAVYANLLAGASQRDLAGEVVNVGTGERHSLNTLAGMMARICGMPHLEPIREPARTGDVMHSLADISAARDLLAYEVLAGMDEGLTETIEWYRAVLADA